MAEIDTNVWDSEDPGEQSRNSLSLTVSNLKIAESLYTNPWRDRRQEENGSETSVTKLTPTETAPSEALDPNPGADDPIVRRASFEENVRSIQARGQSLPSGSRATNETTGAGVPAAPSAANRQVRSSQVTANKTDWFLPPVVLCPSIIQAPSGRHYQKVSCAFPPSDDPSENISEAKKKAIEKTCLNLSHAWTCQDFYKAAEEVDEVRFDSNSHDLSKPGGEFESFQECTIASVRALCQHHLGLNNPVIIADGREKQSVVPSSRLSAAETISAWQTRALEAGKDMVEVSVVLPKCGVTSCQVESDLNWKCLNPKEDEIGDCRSQRFQRSQRNMRRAAQGIQA